MLLASALLMEYLKKVERLSRLHMNHGITEESASNMKSMVGFRNIAVHDYQTINTNILYEIIVHHLDDFTSFTKQILAY